MVVNKLHRMFAVGLIVILLCGCTSLPKIGQSELPTDVADPSTPAATYVVEMQPIFGKPKIFEGQLSEPTRVQGALEASGALKMFSEMSVDLYRRVPNSIPLKMAIEFKKGNQVRYEQDYALHAGDRLVVKPDSGSPMEKLLDQFLGGL